MRGKTIVNIFLLFCVLLFCIGHYTGSVSTQKHEEEASTFHIELKKAPATETKNNLDQPAAEEDVHKQKAIEVAKNDINLSVEIARAQKILADEDAGYYISEEHKSVKKKVGKGKRHRSFRLMPFFFSRICGIME